MKKITISLCALTLLLGSCDGKLDSLRPHNQADEQGYLQTVENITNATSGTYALLHLTHGFSSPKNYYYAYYCISELSGNDIVCVEPFDNWDGIPPLDAHFHLENTKIDNSYASTVWMKTNQIILFSTVNINAIDKALENTLLSDDARRTLVSLRGDNYFLRGFVALNAMTVFARPYWDNPTMNPGLPFDLSGEGKLVARSTVAESFGQIVSDLKNAAEDLPNEALNGTYANRAAAYAYLSRACLYMGGLPGQPNDEYNRLAVTYADEVFKVPGVALEEGAAYRDMYDHPDTSSELLFSFWLQNMSDYGNMLSSLFDWTGSEGSASYAIRPCVASTDLTGIFDPSNDLRWDYFYMESDKYAGRFTTNKFSRVLFYPYSGSRSFAAPIVYIRAAEAVLNRAEANAKLGNAPQALADLNTIRTRAGLGSLSGLSGDALFSAIFEERRRELAFEGHAHYDYVRNGMTMTRSEVTQVYPEYTGAAFNSVDPRTGRTTWFIPDEELSLNPELVQN